jgi:dTMP kinase
VKETYEVVLPGMNLADLTGKLIVIEGTDGVGRSTQINLIKPWLEQQGRAVLDTGITRSELAGKGIKQAKAGHTLGKITLTLFYATDFADRLEHQIVPALRAGFVVLTDRYIYSLMARALMRAIDPDWIRNVYSFALKPDAVFYLRIGVDDLIPRVVFTRGFDYWESGMDLHPSEDMYESFRKYQTSLLAQFDVLAQEYDFDVIDASANIQTVFEALRGGISRVLSGESREPLFAAARTKSAGEMTKAAEAGESHSAREARGSGDKNSAEGAERNTAVHALAGAVEGDSSR